ncbi:hypothetical protein Nepgr_023134 [Nepenthes gracilis]|uniref:Uncharacterized protein n=1 Tax=Nepenthes gracilis TaxID=150966 RepID=A0AAD3T213_NEPGR|nr:hypothetical protein Nepgr_023134 [Nepenthes gracilis]
MGNVVDFADAIATCLNVLLGTPPSNADTDIASDDKSKLRWVETFLLESHDTPLTWNGDAALEPVIEEMGMDILPPKDETFKQA